jgi:hypothetical protein
LVVPPARKILRYASVHESKHHINRKRFAQIDKGTIAEMGLKGLP